VFVQLAEAGSFGGGMLSYFDRSSGCEADSGNFGSLRFRLNFLLSADVEKTDSFSAGFSTGLGTTGTGSAFGVTEKLGARGPFGRAWLGFLFSWAMKLGCI
jgi:hypothetical protein